MAKQVPDDSPGGVVRASMEAKGWTQSDLAYALGTTTASVNYILNNKRGIGGAMARALGVALDCDPAVFARAQAEWEIQSADEPSPEIATRARILTKFPLREMVKRGWIDPEHGKGTLEEQVCRFFDVASLDDVPSIAHSARKTDYDDLPPQQLVWLYRVRKIASEMTVGGYSPEKLRSAIQKMQALRSEPEAVRYVPQLMGEAGVRFVVVEELPGSRIDGVCLWLNSRTPVIGLSMRFDRIDNFWFVLRHECAHVLHGHGRDAAILDVDLEGSNTLTVSEEEKIANDEAADFCVPSAKMQSFYLRKKPFFAEREVLAFAKRMEVHPGIVVGQLQRMQNRYDLLRKHLVRVRASLASAMMMDGWGDVVPTER